LLRCYRITLVPLLIYGVLLWGVGLAGGYFLAYGGSASLPVVNMAKATMVLTDKLIQAARAKAPPPGEAEEEDEEDEIVGLGEELEEDFDDVEVEDAEDFEGDEDELGADDTEQDDGKRN
jgi:hypothetical protein